MRSRLSFFVLAICQISLAGSERITLAKTGSIVKPAHMNQFFGVLTEDFLPRNSTGVVNDIAARLGIGTYRWDSVYIRTLKLGEVGSFITIDNGVLNGADITNATAPLKSLSLPGIVASSSCTAAGANHITSTTFVDVANLSVTITSTGRPVNIMMQGTADGLNSAWQVSGLVGSPVSSNISLGYIRILKNGSELLRTILGVGNKATWDQNYFTAPSMIRYLDPTAAGTNTYTVQARRDANTAVDITCIRTVLVAYEEL